MSVVKLLLLLGGRVKLIALVGSASEETEMYEKRAGKFNCVEYQRTSTFAPLFPYF